MSLFSNPFKKIFSGKKGNQRISPKSSHHAVISQADNTRKERGNSKRAFAVTVLTCIAVCIIIAIAVGVIKLRQIYLEQCVITDMETCVTVKTGSKIKAESIINQLGLHAGVNLATLPLAERRLNIMKRVPMIKDIRITRTLPNKIAVDVIEREPVAQLPNKDNRRLVCDDEGVVFAFYKRTSSLPIIIDRSRIEKLKEGDRLGAQTLSALQLIIACDDKEFPMISVREVDASKPDFLMLTLERDSARVKISWEKMNKPGNTSKASMMKQLQCLNKHLSMPCNQGVRLFDATIEGRITSRFTNTSL